MRWIARTRASGPAADFPTALRLLHLVGRNLYTQAALPLRMRKRLVMDMSLIEEGPDSYIEGLGRDFGIVAAAIMKR